MNGKYSKRKRFSKPNPIIDQLRALKVGQTKYCPSEIAKIDTMRQAAQRLKAEGLYLKVSVNGIDDGCVVTRVSNEQREAEY